MLTIKDYCDYDTSITLGELGFPLKRMKVRNFIDGKFSDSVVTVLLYEAQKWLREQRLLLIEIDKILYGGYKFHVLDLTTYTEESCGYTDGYEEALSEGIKEAVKILKEK